jgi:acetyl esterase/lipase
MKNIRYATLLSCATLALWQISTATAAEDTSAHPTFTAPPIKPDGTIDIPAFSMPYSNYASDESKHHLIEHQVLERALDEASKGGIAALRRTYDEKSFFPLIAKQNARYQVESHPETIGGVYTEVFTPRAGVSARNENRVLINLHGGAFILGARTVGRIESIPIAATGKIKVISVDYRQAPEYTFPAASEDVAAVYKEVLKHYQPQNVGIYGCSSGGMLAGEAMAWFQKEKLPRPGAIGLFCSSTNGLADGDSQQLADRLTGASGELPARKPDRLGGPYFKGVSPTNPLAVPSASPAVLARFPPTLFITGTRAIEMSGAAKSQIELALLGVDARILIWDGMTHGFLFDPELPESREAYQIITEFFDAHLGIGATAVR